MKPKKVKLSNHTLKLRDTKNEGRNRKDAKCRTINNGQENKLDNASRGAGFSLREAVSYMSYSEHND